MEAPKITQTLEDYLKAIYVLAEESQPVIAARMAAEDPADPATWTWTAADSLFLALVAQVHRRGMRLIMDYSWNHTGTAFWAWRDVLEHQRRFAQRRADA